MIAQYVFGAVSGLSNFKLNFARFLSSASTINFVDSLNKFSIQKKRGYSQGCK